MVDTSGATSSDSRRRASAFLQKLRCDRSALICVADPYFSGYKAPWVPALESYPCAELVVTHVLNTHLGLVQLFSLTPVPYT
jgi:hypothetical protein